MTPLPSRRPTRSLHPLAWRARTEVALPDGALLSLRVQAGDLLRGEGGCVWLTRDGHLRDLLLEAGQVYRVESDATLHASGLGDSTMSLVHRDGVQEEIRPRSTVFGWTRWWSAPGRRLFGPTPARSPAMAR